MANRSSFENADLSLVLKHWAAFLDTNREERQPFDDAWAAFVGAEPDLIDAAGRAGVQGMAHKRFRDAARDDENQLSFAGVEVPATIYVGGDSGGVLVPIHAATHDEWVTFYEAREQNYERVAAKYFSLRELNARIRPRWDRQPSMLFADVVVEVFGPAAIA